MCVRHDRISGSDSDRRAPWCPLTTSLSFYGEGGETLGARGYSKDYRPDLKQMIVAAVIDAEGRPICTEMVPGNTADSTVLLPVVDRLRDRFGVTRVCVVADRGMISAATISALEARKLEYILGARERSTTVIRDIVLNDDAPFTPLAPTHWSFAARRARAVQRPSRFQPAA
jgi:transposase